MLASNGGSPSSSLESCSLTVSSCLDVCPFKLPQGSSETVDLNISGLQLGGRKGKNEIPAKKSSRHGENQIKCKCLSLGKYIRKPSATRSLECRFNYSTQNCMSTFFNSIKF